MQDDGDIFPWMKATKVSEKGGTELLSNECHPYHMYFGMPRRIRLDIAQISGTCDLTNDRCQTLVIGYRTRHSGNDYDGAWIHPLNAYRVPKKAKELPISIKPKLGGACYRHWLGLVFPNDTRIRARVVDVAITSNYRRTILNRYQAILWAAGYQMDKMKALCWYESNMPVYALDKDGVSKIGERVSVFIDQASNLANALHFAVKGSWFSRPKDAKGDVSFLTISYWHNTESDFYQLLGQMVKSINDASVWAECAKQWQTRICREALALFDQWALAQQEDGLDMRRVVKARNELGKKVGKARKAFHNLTVVE